MNTATAAQELRITLPADNDHRANVEAVSAAALTRWKKALAARAWHDPDGEWAGRYWADMYYRAQFELSRLDRAA